jgi:hypothetical protein
VITVPHTGGPEPIRPSGDEKHIEHNSGTSGCRVFKPNHRQLYRAYIVEDEEIWRGIVHIREWQIHSR